MSDDAPDRVDAPDNVQAAHALTTALRAEGYTIGFDTEDIVEDFDEHREMAAALLDEDDVAAFFITVAREGQTDYSSSVIVDDSTVWGVTQIQLLGAHFRTVLDTLPLSTTELVDAIVDEAVTIEENDDD